MEQALIKELKAMTYARVLGKSKGRGGIFTPEPSREDSERFLTIVGVSLDELRDEVVVLQKSSQDLKDEIAKLKLRQFSIDLTKLRKDAIEKINENPLAFAALCIWIFHAVSYIRILKRASANSI